MTDPTNDGPVPAPPPSEARRRLGGATFAAGGIVPFEADYACGECGHLLHLPKGAAFPSCPACSESKVIYRRVMPG